MPNPLDAILNAPQPLPTYTGPAYAAPTGSPAAQAAQDRQSWTDQLAVPGVEMSPMASLASRVPPTPDQQIQNNVQQPGRFKQMLMGALWGASRGAFAAAGIESPEETQYKQGMLGVQQQNAATNEGYRQFQQKVGEYGMDQVPVVNPMTGQSMMVSRKDAAGLQKTFATIQGNLTKQEGINESREAIAKLNADVKDRYSKALLDYRKAIQDKNYGLAEQRFQALENYRRAQLGLAGGRLDLAREALDYRETGPTMQMKNRGQFATTLMSHVPEINAEIDRLDKMGKLGPLAGRFSDFIAGRVGADDPDYVYLHSLLSLYSTGMMQTHFGGRSGIEAQKYFENLLNRSGQSASNLKAAISGTIPYLATYEQGGQFRGRGLDNTAPNSGAVRFQMNGTTYNIPGDKVAEFLKDNPGAKKLGR